MITVIGAGSGKAENISLIAYKKIKEASKVILKTKRMTLAKLLEEENVNFDTLDDLYEQAEDFDALNALIKERLEKEDCVYVVHGSALDDTSVQVLEGIEIIAGVSVADCAAAYMNLPKNIKAYTATEILSGATPSQHEDVIVTSIDSTFIAGDLKCFLADIYGDEAEIDFYTEDFSGIQFSKKIMLYEMDMQDNYNHTTCVFIKKTEFEKVSRYDIKHLIDIVDKLCSRDGCPWDSIQTHESLRAYLIEEAYEVADTIDKDDPFRLYDELGDVLYLAVLHANIAKRCGEFDFLDITDAISRKMISRHPQIFSDIKPSGDLNDLWETAKKKEKGINSTYEVMNDVPIGLASLARAEKILHKAEKAGIKHESTDKNIEEIISLLNSKKTLDEADIGQILFDFVKLCYSLKVHPELALNNKIKEYIEQFSDENE